MIKEKFGDATFVLACTSIAGHCLPVDLLAFIVCQKKQAHDSWRLLFYSLCFNVKGEFCRVNGHK